MATTLLPKKYTSQAREHVYVDFSNPLADGLVSAYGLTSYEIPVRSDGVTGKLNGRKSSATPNPYTLHGYRNDGSTEAVNVLTQEGSAWSFDGTYSTKAYSPAHPKNWSTPVTFIIRVYLNSNTADQCVIGNFNDSLTPDYKYGCGIYISGGTLYGVGANNNSRVISATAPDTGRWVTLACVTNTSDGRLYIDGQLVASGTLAGASSNYVFGIGCSGHTSAGATDGVSFLNGMVGYALTYKRALSSAEIYALSKNPYQILRAKKNYLIDAIAGLSSVSNDVVLTYNTLSAAQSDNTISWNILNSISQDGSILWNLQNSVSSDNSISWDLISQVISDKGLSWDILSSAVKDGVLSWDSISSVTSNTDVSWNVVSSVFVDKSINYDVLANVTSNQSTSWNIAQFVFADKSIEWDISSTMLTAFADIALRYDIVSNVYQDFNTYWDLLQQVGSNQQIDFDILTSVLSDKAITWGIAEAVANDLTIVANLLQNTGQDLSITWDSAGIVSGDLVIKYNISTDAVILPPIERILKISLQDRTLKVLQQSIQDRTLKVVQQSRILSIQ